jgi:diacylglycerol kinase
MGILKSFYYARRGIGHILRYERNARIHLVSAVLVLIAGWLVGLSDAELAAVFFAIIIVFLAEIINSAFEKTLDIIRPEHSEQVRMVKDMAAGAVLVAAIGAAIIGVSTFGPHVWSWWWPQ